MHHYYRDNTVEDVYPINSSVLLGQYLENEDDSRGFDENEHPNGFVNDWDSHRDFSEGPYNNPGWDMSHPRGENFGRYESQRHRTTFTPEHYQRGSNNRHIQTVTSRYEETQPSQRCEQMSYRQRSHYNNQRKETEFHGKREKFSFPKEAWCPRKVNAFQAKRTCATRRSPPRELRQITNVSKTIGPHKKLIKSRFFSENESSSVKIVSSVKNEASSVKQAASLVKKEASSVRNGASSVMNKASSVKTGPSVGKEESSVKNEASFVKTAAASVKIAPPVGKEASSVKNEASFVKTAAASVKIAPPVGKEASSVKNEASIVKTAAASVKFAPPVRKEASSVKNIASSVKNAAYSVKTAPSVRKEASSVKKGASSVKTAASSVEKEASSVKNEAYSVKAAPSVGKEASSVRNGAPSVKTAASSAEKEASSVKKEATSVKKGASSVKNEDSSVKTATSSNGKEEPEELWSDLSDVSMDLGTDEDDFSESANQKQNGIPDAKNNDVPQDESTSKINTSNRENNNASSDKNLPSSISRNPEEKCCMSNDNAPEEKLSSNAPQNSETSKKEETIPAQLNPASKLFKKSLVTENHDDCKQTKNKNNTTEALVDPRTKSTEITISKNLPLELKLPQFWTEFKKRKMRPKIVKKQNEFLVPKKLKTRVKRIHNKPSVCARNLREIKKYVKSNNPTKFCCHVSIQKNECNIAPAPEISGSSDFMISMMKTINTSKSYLPEPARKNKDETSEAKISENKNSNTKNKQHIESKKLYVEGEKRKHADDTKSKPLKTEIPKSSKKNILPHSTTSNSKSNTSEIENLFETPLIEKKIGVKRECLDPPSNNIKTKKIRLENTSANKKAKNVIWEQQKSSTNKNKPSEGGLNTPINKKIKNGIVGNYRNILKSAADVVKPQVDSACNTSFILGILQKADNTSKFQTSSENKKKYDEGMSSKPNTNDGKLKNEKNKPRNILEAAKPKINDSSSAPASNPSIISEISKVGRSLPMIVDDSVFSEASEPSVSEECATKVLEKVPICQEINTTNDMEYSLHIPESYKDSSDDLMKALDESIDSITASISASKLKSDSKQIDSSTSKQNAAVCPSSAVTDNSGSHKETYENSSKTPTQLSPPNENVIASKSTEDNCCLSDNITGDKLIEFLGEDEDEMLLIVKVIENPEIKEEVDEGLVNSIICEDQPEVKIEETNELSANIPEALPGDVEAEQGGSVDENTPSGPSITVRSDIKVVSPEESIGSLAEVETEQQSNFTRESAADVTTISTDASADSQSTERGPNEDGSQLFHGLLVSIPTTQTNTAIGMTMSSCSSDSPSAKEHLAPDKQTAIPTVMEPNRSGGIENNSMDTSTSFSINEATGYASTPVKDQTSTPVNPIRININSDNVPHAYNNCTDNLMPMRRSIPQMRNLRKSNTYNLNSTFNSVFKIVREYNEMTLRVDYISNGLTSINNHYVFEMDINNAKFLKTRLRMVFGDLMLSHLSTLPRTIRLNDMFIMRLLDCCARNIPAEKKHMMIEKIWDLINVHSEKYEKYEYLKDWKRYIENELKMQCYLGVNMSSAQYWLLKDQICSYLNLLRPKNGRQTQTNPNKNMGARDSSRNLFASRNVGMFPTQQGPSAMILTTQTCYVSTGNAANLRPNLQQPVSSHLKSPEANVAYPRYNAFQACQGQNAGFNAFQQRPNVQFSNENLRPNNAAFDHMNKRVPNAASEQMKSKAVVGNARNTHLDASKKHPNSMESILQPSSMNFQPNTQELNGCCRMETCSNMNATTRRLHCDAEKDLTLRALLSTSNTQTEGINHRDVWFNPPNVTVAACNLKSSVGQKHGLDPTFQPKSKKVCLAQDFNNSTDCSRKTSPANVHVSPGVQAPASAIRNDKGMNSTSGGFKLSPPSTSGSPERAGSPYSTSFESFFGAASNAPSSAPFNVLANSSAQNDAALSHSASSHAAAQACNTAPTSPCYVATSHLASPVTISEVPYPTPPISNSASSYAPSPTPNAQGDTAEGQTEEKPETKPSLCTIGCDFSKDPKTEPEEIIDLTWLDEDMVKEELFDSGDEATEQSLLILDNRKCVCEKVAEYLCSCNTVMYCSEECQLKDWINHQRVCSSVVIAPGVPDGNANTFI